MSKLITVRQAADSLSISPKQLRRLIDDGQIPVIPCGRGAKGDRIDPEDVEVYKRRVKRLKSVPCLSSNVVRFGGLKLKSVESELENLLAPKRRKKTRAN